MEYNYNDDNCHRDLIDFLPESSVDVWDDDRSNDAPIMKSKDRGRVNSDVVAIKSDTGDIAFVAVSRTPQKKHAGKSKKKLMARPDSLPTMIANPSAAGIDNFGYQTITKNESYTYDDTGFNYFSHLDSNDVPQYVSPVGHQPRYVKLDGQRTTTNIRRGSYGDLPSTSQDPVLSQSNYRIVSVGGGEQPCYSSRSAVNTQNLRNSPIQQTRISPNATADARNQQTPRSSQQTGASTRRLPYVAPPAYRMSPRSGDVVYHNRPASSRRHSQDLDSISANQEDQTSNRRSRDLEAVNSPTSTHNTPVSTSNRSGRRSSRDLEALNSPTATQNPPVNTSSRRSSRDLEALNSPTATQNSHVNTSSRSSRSSSRDLGSDTPSTPVSQAATPKLPPLCKICGQNHGVTENHEYDYVDEVDEDLMCDICLQPLVDPYDTACGHTFCNICLMNYLKVKDICPVDRVKLTNSNSDCWQSSLILRKLVNKLSVTCPYDTVCQKTLPRCELKDHLQDNCPGVVIRCPKSMHGCLHRCPRSQMKSHIENCRFKDLTDKLSDLHPFSEDITVDLFRPEGTAELGIMIVGGNDTPVQYVMVQEIIPGSLVADDGRLHVGDIFVEVNGESMFSVTHAEARSILMKPSSLMKFHLLRDIHNNDDSNEITEPQNKCKSKSAHEETVCLVKPPLEQLGIRISSSEIGDKGVYIIELIPDQVAKTDGRLQVGDRILRIGDTDLTDSTPEHAARVIGSCDKEVKIHVRHLTTSSAVIMFNESVEEEKSRKAKLNRSDTYVVKPKISKSKRTKKMISVVKSPRDNLGIVVSGGNCSPHGNLPIFVQNVLPFSVLGKDKRIKRGDLLSEINSIKLTGLSHNQAMGVLRECAQQREVTLVVYELEYDGKAEDEALWDELTSLHQNPSTWAPSWKMWLAASRDFSSMKELVLKRQSGTSYGFKISEGIVDATTPIPIFITHISKNSPASKVLKCGDEIVAINKRPVREMNHAQVLHMIRSVTCITLKVVSWPGSLH